MNSEAAPITLCDWVGNDFADAAHDIAGMDYDPVDSEHDGADVKHGIAELAHDIVQGLPMSLARGMTSPTLSTASPIDA